ncbi:hypothetical protein DFP74_3873 [Nocardiopsis sp. Huas11]|uniref:hypothetical protein n=1 Tax=Nocardiopsis sp. Huas11 TaxID=2183912 RepID=UPI000EADC5C4|nr:hypothetical protein [Nocardiopsis sp. Huas11]RKS08179.1 hypothetical protein DFP74_3873 [Nocardiopsis sp. Huas11]
MIITSFPFDPNRSRLERSAREHARALALERGTFDDGPVPVDRLVVNYLRHACTDYDRDQSAVRHRAACEAIARTFPWLAQECDRQIARRAQDDAAAQAAREAWVQEQEAERERRRAVVVDSREAITALRVGQKVSFPYKRQRYTGVVTKLGRSRVAVAYRIATGRDRDRVRLVHASLVRPEDDP